MNVWINLFIFKIEQGRSSIEKRAREELITELKWCINMRRNTVHHGNPSSLAACIITKDSLVCLTALNKTFNEMFDKCKEYLLYNL